MTPERQAEARRLLSPSCDGGGRCGNHGVALVGAGAVDAMSPTALSARLLPCVMPWRHGSGKLGC